MIIYIDRQNRYIILFYMKRIKMTYQSYLLTRSSEPGRHERRVENKELVFLRRLRSLAL